MKKPVLKETPTTWEEFEEDCQKIADIGEIPVIIGGSDAWQIMRYLSFSPWRVTGSGIYSLDIRLEQTLSVKMSLQNMV